jgi:hypothetical protein
MKPLLSAFALPPERTLLRNDPCNEITEEDAIYESTLLAPGLAPQRETKITEVQRETTDDN